MIRTKNQMGKMPVWRRLFAFFCLFASFCILSGCSRENEGTIYLSGTSMFKITVGSSSGTKEAEALNKAGKPLLADLKWKGKAETEVLDALVQKMQSEEAKKIYIDVLGTDKSWTAGEIQKLSEFFSEATYESTIPVEIRSASDLDGEKASGASGSGENTEEQRLSLSEDSRPNEKSEPDESSAEESTGEESSAEESSAQEGPDGESSSEPGMTNESTEDGSVQESFAAPETTAVPTTARPTAAATTAAPRDTTAVPKTTAPARTTAAAPQTAAPQTAAPETAAPETAAPETAAPVPETTVPETAAPSPEAEVQNSGNGEAAASTKSRNSNVYIPTKTIEDDQSFGPGW